MVRTSLLTFTLGTAAIVCPVERIGYLGKDIHVPVGEAGMGPIAKGFLREIVGRQIGAIPSEWSVLVSA
jgi:branched-chain amino acid aminotransferase